MGRTLIVIGSLLIIAVTAASPASAKSSSQEDQYASVPIVQDSGGDRTLQWQFEQQWGVGGVADTLLETTLKPRRYCDIAKPNATGSASP